MSPIARHASAAELRWRLLRRKSWSKRIVRTGKSQRARLSRRLGYEWVVGKTEYKLALLRRVAL